MRILIVEDESLIAMLLQDMLEDLGHEVIAVADTVADALPHIELCDVAILDLNLGAAGSSLPVAEALRDRGTPYMFSSGYAEEAIEGHSPVAYLQKPYSLSALSDRLSKIA